MQSSITLGESMTLFGVMAALAAVPGLSVLVVSARSAAFGFTHGVFAAMGIVAGDIFYILVAILGLSMLAEAMGEWFALVKYLGAVYLVWMGVVIWRSASGALEAAGRTGGSTRLSSFLAGLFLTLGDQKAVLFYLGFFPAFFDVSVITRLDVCLIMAITTVAVGGVKVAYAYMAGRAGLLLNFRFKRGVSMAGGGVLVLVGFLQLIKSLINF